MSQGSRGPFCYLWVCHYRALPPRHMARQQCKLNSERSWDGAPGERGLLPGSVGLNSSFRRAARGRGPGDSVRRAAAWTAMRDRGIPVCVRSGLSIQPKIHRNEPWSKLSVPDDALRIHTQQVQSSILGMFPAAETLSESSGSFQELWSLGISFKLIGSDGHPATHHPFLRQTPDNNPDRGLFHELVDNLLEDRRWPKCWPCH
ncbi:hypothetical protein EYF80_006658 [Liparis tanakae]|uniref:Uncharacterized protein n=1 Tax=Liparis tanakae TaxID=230148 RepID=A0A4Z2IZ40_9TELE|nr:hypothetical protein EYF80_006658 [Liparis tanakae]